MPFFCNHFSFNSTFSRRHFPTIHPSFHLCEKRFDTFVRHHLARFLLIYYPAATEVVYALTKKFQGFNLVGLIRARAIQSQSAIIKSVNCQTDVANDPRHWPGGDSVSW